MKMTRARGFLLSIFILFFVVAAASIIVPFINREVYSDSMLAMLKKLLTVYSVPFAVIVGGIFGQRKSQLKSVPPFAFWSFLILAVIWNIFVVWRIVWFALAHDDTVGALTAYLDRVVPFCYFLVAVGLSYFFAKRW